MAANCYKNAANKGEKRAFYQLGTFYERGIYFHKNLTHAHENYVQAANLECPEAQYYLGMNYMCHQ